MRGVWERHVVSCWFLDIRALSSAQGHAAVASVLSCLFFGTLKYFSTDSDKVCLTAHDILRNTRILRAVYVGYCLVLYCSRIS